MTRPGDPRDLVQRQPGRAGVLVEHPPRLQQGLVQVTPQHLELPLGAWPRGPRPNAATQVDYAATAAVLHVGLTRVGRYLVPSRSIA
jgi:hypothetical protein